MYNINTHIVVILLSLPLLALCQTNFTDVLYAEFGYRSSGNAYLSASNLTDMFHQVLNGHTYNEQATACSASNCSSDACYMPVLDQSLSIEDFQSSCPQILYSLTQDCIKSDREAEEHAEEGDKEAKPPPSSVWGFGLLFVTLINLCSLAGVFVLPLMKKKIYSSLLMFLIALAVGSLTANGLLVLIPEAFEIVDMEGFTWKACTIVGGIYLFFVTERILKMITDYVVAKRHENVNDVPCNDIVGSIPTQTYLDINRPMEMPGNSCNGEQLDPELSSHALLAKESAANSDHKLNGDSNGMMKLDSEDRQRKTPKKPVATVAWMIIFGDAFHNFIDGLSIGAAFSESVVLGVSICIAVLCEELPHELGDFAILLNAGMSKKKALLFNFLSACTCYLGLIIGITLSEVAHATPWILGLAGGMFLYISLADMMPEMNRAAEENKDKPITIFMIQNAGFLCGVGIILTISHFGAQISI